MRRREGRIKGRSEEAKEKEAERMNKGKRVKE